MDPYKKEIYNGAYVLVRGDAGVLFRRWKRLSGSRVGTSSHASRGKQYRYKTLIGEILFGEHADSGDTWFQYERFSTEIEWVACHVLACLRYEVTNKNIGPIDVSSFTEALPLLMSRMQLDAIFGRVTADMPWFTHESREPDRVDMSRYGM